MVKATSDGAKIIRSHACISANLVDPKEQAQYPGRDFAFLLRRGEAASTGRADDLHGAGGLAAVGTELVFDSWWHATAGES